MHRFAYNILVYTDATKSDIIEIESGIWKQKHKVKYLVPTLEFNNTRTYDCNAFKDVFDDNTLIEHEEIINNEEFNKLQNLVILDDTFKNMKNNLASRQITLYIIWGIIEIGLKNKVYINNINM